MCSASLGRPGPIYGFGDVVLLTPSAFGQSALQPLLQHPLCLLRACLGIIVGDPAGEGKTWLACGSAETAAVQINCACRV
ncbi:hypothetical protein J2Y86_002709 [Pseudomonas migulae]|nr:hypothetical protein [Pseudomonas migulae]